MSNLYICCSCDAFYGKDPLACAKNIASGTTTPCGCDCHKIALDIRLRVRDFACDSEQHDIGWETWKLNHKTFPGIVLYSFGGFYTAYFADAAELWNQADDDRPMFHVMVKSDPPHRTCIAPEDLEAWVEHLASIFLPVTILGREDE